MSNMNHISGFSLINMFFLLVFRRHRGHGQVCGLSPRKPGRLCSGQWLGIAARDDGVTKGP